MLAVVVVVVAVVVVVVVVLVVVVVVVLVDVVAVWRCVVWGYQHHTMLGSWGARQKARQVSWLPPTAHHALPRHTNTHTHIPAAAHRASTAGTAR